MIQIYFSATVSIYHFYILKDGTQSSLKYHFLAKIGLKYNFFPDTPPPPTPPPVCLGLTIKRDLCPTKSEVFKPYGGGVLK